MNAGDHDLTGHGTAPLHRAIYRQLRQEIARDYRAGDNLPSQNELAKRFGVSFVTLREALSILVEEGVIVRHRGRDTVVINPTAGQHLAVLIEQDITHPRSSYHLRQVMQQLRCWLRGKGWSVRAYLGVAIPSDEGLPVLDTGDDQTCPELVAEIDAGRVRGVAAIGGISSVMAKRIRAANLPLVGQETHLDYSVRNRVEDLVRQGVNYLVAHGRRRLAFISWHDPSFIVRYARELELDVRLQWIRCGLQHSDPGIGWTEFRELWASPNDRPNGILITDEVLFANALHAMIDAHVPVPEQLMVVTHTCMGAPFWAPFPVTRLESNPDIMAQTIGEMLLGLLDQRPPAQPHIILPPQLVEGDPAAKPQDSPAADSH